MRAPGLQQLLWFVHIQHDCIAWQQLLQLALSWIQQWSYKLSLLTEKWLQLLASATTL